MPPEFLEKVRHSIHGFVEVAVSIESVEMEFVAFARIHGEIDRFAAELLRLFRKAPHRLDWHDAVIRAVKDQGRR